MQPMLPVTAIANRLDAHQRLARRRRRRRRARLLGSIVGAIVCAAAVGAGVVVAFHDDSKRARARGEAFELAEQASAAMALGVTLTSFESFIDSAPAGLRSTAVDPWGRAWVLITPPLRNAWGVTIVSAGPDGVFFTDDDVGNWPE